MTDANFEFLQTLETVIEERKSASTEESYTAKLFAAGPVRIAQKVGEEGVELAIAGAQGNEKRDRLGGGGSPVSRPRTSQEP